ncbi:MAG: PEP-CTERM sorting domain-containing protein [Phenylobacterium sp.]|nr:PEP-CTERM sorting domain-containing protein [Phenylobacterium sp.]
MAAPAAAATTVFVDLTFEEGAGAYFNLGPYKVWVENDWWVFRLDAVTHRGLDADVRDGSFHVKAGEFAIIGKNRTPAYTQYYSIDIDGTAAIYHQVNDGSIHLLSELDDLPGFETLPISVTAPQGAIRMTSSADWSFDNVRLVNTVPEPGTWALMIGGFGLAGSALRRRRHSTI